MVGLTKSFVGRGRVGDKKLAKRAKTRLAAKPKRGAPGQSLRHATKEVAVSLADSDVIELEEMDRQEAVRLSREFFSSKALTR